MSSIERRQARARRHSLRGRIALRLGIATFCLLAFGAWFVNRRIEKEVVGAYDRSLLARAQTIAALTELEGGRTWVLEFDEALISYGGSSTIALCLGVGFLLAITRRNPFLKREPFTLRELEALK